MALARGDGLDRPRDARASSRAAGTSVLDTIAGELDEPLAELAAERGGRLWLPFTRTVAEALLETRGARLDPRALRCASRLQVDLDPAPATLALVEGYGELRFKLDINWDPETLPAFLALPACEAHGRTLPVDPYLLEPLEHYLRLFGVEPAANAREVLDRLRREHDAAIDDVRRSRAVDARGAGGRGRASAASCGRSSARASPTCCTPGARSWPTSRASARPCRRSPRWRPTTPTRP